MPAGALSVDICYKDCHYRHDERSNGAKKIRTFLATSIDEILVFLY